MTQQETWIPIEGHETRYSVSNLGRVMRTSKGGAAQVGKILKPAMDGCGYLRIALCHNYISVTCKVHRLVARAFHGPIPPLYTVNHKDGNKINNSAENLEIVTRAENVAHCFRVIKTRTNTGEDNPKAKVSAAQVREIRARLASGESRKSIGAAFGVNRHLIHDIARNRSWVGV